MKVALEKVIENAAKVIPQNAEDYLDEESGLLFCGQCHTPKQCRIFPFGRERLVSCLCQCGREKRNAEEAAQREKERLERIGRLKANALQNAAFHAYTFDKDDGHNPAIRYARNYVEHWREFLQRGQGLLFWGSVGTGKTFAAACIANALVEQCVPVLMTNFARILNSLSGLYSEDKNTYLASLNQFSLLIIDDLGIERNSEYTLEQVYNVVDSRYLSGLPFIITTNLSISDLKSPKDLAHARIYDRVLERCVPICFSGRNYRKDSSAVNKNEAARLLKE